MRGLLLIGLLLSIKIAVCQKYIVEKSNVSFFSDAAIEDITAENEKAMSIFNSATSEIVFSIPIKEFQFAKSLMQEHFNEKYMEAEKYPKATFQGKLIDYHSEMKGTQQVKAAGKLTIHGVTKEVEIPGVIDTSGKEIVMKSKFFILLEDYQVTRPQLLWQNIAEKVEVTLAFTYKPM
ncbi:MAG TPA: YceI family protein [Cyclobacteriaceae bacterium]